MDSSSRGLHINISVNGTLSLGKNLVAGAFHDSHISLAITRSLVVRNIRFSASPMSSVTGGGNKLEAILGRDAKISTGGVGECASIQKPF